MNAVYNDVFITCGYIRILINVNRSIVLCTPLFLLVYRYPWFHDAEDHLCLSNSFSAVTGNAGIEEHCLQVSVLLLLVAPFAHTPLPHPPPLMHPTLPPCFPSYSILPSPIPTHSHLSSPLPSFVPSPSPSPPLPPIHTVPKWP